MFMCLFFNAIFVVSLRDYPCRRPVRVVSSAAQAAAVVPPVRRHGEMLRLINRRQYCLIRPSAPQHSGSKCSVLEHLESGLGPKLAHMCCPGKYAEIIAFYSPGAY